MAKLRNCCIICLFCAAAAVGSPAQGIFFRTVLSFEGTNGSNPRSELVQASDGNFYGTTVWGGAHGSGTVFKITPAGTLTTVYSFCAQPNCADGAEPGAALVQATDGNFYGTTIAGGVNWGTVFKITPVGVLTTLHSFNNGDGATPYARLVQAADGNFYGTTRDGGIYWGTVFKISPNGTFTLLYSFDGADGEWPFGGVVQATDGNFYGTTVFGGLNNAGTVFKITAGGALTTLHSFNNHSDGAEPFAGLVQASDENFYGTTDGTVFKITSEGVLTTLSSLDSFGSDAALVQATDENFYGTSSAYPYCCDTVFKITPAGTLTTLHTFDRGDGAFGALVQASDGTFYGTTYYGGDYGAGTIYRIGVAGPCAKCRP